MKKNVIIVVLLVVTILSLMYAFVKGAEANVHRGEAVKNAEIAHQQRKIAQERQARLVAAEKEIQDMKNTSEGATKLANQMYERAVVENAKKKSGPKK